MESGRERIAEGWMFGWLEGWFKEFSQSSNRQTLQSSEVTMNKKKIDFKQMHSTESALSGMGLKTVCHQARCPNLSECFSRGTATFLILGDNCTRQCGFCNVSKKMPCAVDNEEPGKVAQAVKKLNLKYAVVTSVTRDDLPDFGASHYARTINEIKKENPEIKVEVLVPDFMGNALAIETVLDAKPFCFAHNVETVPSLYFVRPGASYERSLSVIRQAKNYAPEITTKSALLMGLGEIKEEVIKVFTDLVSNGCDNISIGQYLAPSKQHAQVKKELTDDEFKEYEELAVKAGFKSVMSGRWVRSSYLAEQY